MSAVNVKFNIEFKEYTIPVVVTDYYGGSPGRLYGPPEDCDPPEAATVEFEINTGHPMLDELLYDGYYYEIEDLVFEQFQAWTEAMIEDRY